MQLQTVTAAELCFGILENDFHRPFVDGKANRDNIEDAITVGMLNKELGYVNKADVDIAIALVDDMLALYKVKE